MENLTPNDEMRKKLRDYKEIIIGFSELLVQENKSLNDYDFEAVTKLYDQKAHIVTAYRNLVAFFIKNQEALTLLDIAEKENLKEISIKLDDLLKENEILLKTRMETSKSVMDSIVRIVKVTSNANSTSYGSQGKYSPLDNSKNAIAINRTL